MATLEWTGVFAAVAAVGGVGGIVSFLRVPSERRKLGADTHKVEVDGAVVISTAALAQMQAAIDQAERAEKRAAASEERADRMEDRQNQMERNWRAHQRWDVEATEALRKFGAVIGDPPPISVEDKRDL